MAELSTIQYETSGRIARITLDRPERGNAITLEMPRELERCVERANLDPAVHVIALAGNGKGFCGGYDLLSAEGKMDAISDGERPAGSPLDPQLLLNQTTMAQGLAASQLLGTVFDGIARHTEEGHAFAARAAEAGFRSAARERDEPFGDAGRSTFKG